MISRYRLLNKYCMRELRQWRSQLHLSLSFYTRCITCRVPIRGTRDICVALLHLTLDILLRPLLTQSRPPRAVFFLESSHIYPISSREVLAGTFSAWCSVVTSSGFTFGHLFSSLGHFGSLFSSTMTAWALLLVEYSYPCFAVRLMDITWLVLWTGMA